MNSCNCPFPFSLYQVNAGCLWQSSRARTYPAGGLHPQCKLTHSGTGELDAQMHMHMTQPCGGILDGNWVKKITATVKRADAEMMLFRRCGLGPFCACMCKFNGHNANSLHPYSPQVAGIKNREIEGQLANECSLSPKSKLRDCESQNDSTGTLPRSTRFSLCHSLLHSLHGL